MPRIVSDNPRAQAIAAALDEAGLDLPDDLCLVLGGDGTMLRAIRQGGGALRYLGVNCGFLGFLMNDLPEDPGEAAAEVRRIVAEGDWFTRDFPRLRMVGERVGGGAMDELAVNDVYVERVSGQTCHLRVVVDGVEAVSRLVCDGLIAATPLGSTAYSFSAGGPAAHPLLQGITLTAICPHVPRLAPLVLPDSAVIEIEVLEPERRPARAAVDGAQHAPVAAVRVQASGDRVALGFRRGHDFTATLIRKVLRA